MLCYYILRSEESSLSPMSPFKAIKPEIAILEVASLCPGPIDKNFRSLGSPCPAGEFLPVHSQKLLSLYPHHPTLLSP